MLNQDKLLFLFNTDYYYSFIHYLNIVIENYNKYVLPNKRFIYKPRFILKFFSIYYYKQIKYILQSILIYFSLKINRIHNINLKLRLKRLYYYYYYVFSKKFTKTDIIEYNTFNDILLNLIV